MKHILRAAGLVAIALAWGCVQRIEAQEPPDVFILFTDQQRGDALGLEGTPGANTPSMDKLANSGIRFNRAFCITPQCSPARGTLWTGLYPHRTGVMGNTYGTNPPPGQSDPLPKDVPNIAALFKDAGYDTAYFGKWHLGNDPKDYGWDVYVNGRQAGDEKVTQEAVQFLNDRKSDKPVLVVVSWINPHDIYNFPGQRKKSFAGESDIPVPRSHLDDLKEKPAPQAEFVDKGQAAQIGRADTGTWKKYRAFYFQENRKVDDQLGRVIDAINKNNAGALVVFSSDHGDLAGDHNMAWKGPAMYEGLVRIPFFVSWPGKIKPGVNSELVTHLDVLPTVCDLAGVKPPAKLDGKSLRPLLEGRDAADWREEVYGQYYGKQRWRVPIRMVRTKKWKYTRYLIYGEELYDLENDPEETNNLAKDPKHASTLADFRARMDRWIEKTDDPFEKLGVTNRKGERVKP